MLLTELGGCHAAEAIVGSVLVVVDREAPACLADVLEPGEQMNIKDFLAVGAVEALDVGVLVRLAGLDVLDRHAVCLRPLHERLAEELRSVVHAQHLRQGPLLADLLEQPDQPLRRDRGVDLDVDDLAVEVVGDVEGAEAAAADQCILEDAEVSSFKLSLLRRSLRVIYASTVLRSGFALAS